MHFMHSYGCYQLVSFVLESVDVRFYFFILCFALTPGPSFKRCVSVHTEHKFPSILFRVTEKDKMAQESNVAAAAAAAPTYAHKCEKTPMFYYG